MKKNILFLITMLMLLAIPFALAGSVTRSITKSGTDVAVTLTIAPVSETYYAIDESYPTGATVTANGGGDATTRPPHIFWVVTSGAAATTYTYHISVPSTWSTAVFSGQYIFENGAASDIGGSTSIALDGTCTPSCSGKVCGSDSCGGVCGACAGTCTSGQCINTCSNGATQACSVGTCAGTQTCTNNAWGTCAKTDSSCGVDVCTDPNGCDGFCQYMTWAKFASETDYCMYGIGMILGGIVLLILFMKK